MSSINRMYWIWDDSLNNTEFKLDTPIEGLLVEKKISPTNSIDEYKVNNNKQIKSIKVRDNRVVALLYSRNADFFLKNGLIDLKYNLFVEEMNKILKQTTQDYEGDLLYVFFRDFFVSNISIIKGR